MFTYTSFELVQTSNFHVLSRKIDGILKLLVTIYDWMTSSPRGKKLKDQIVWQVLPGGGGWKYQIVEKDPAND